MLVGQPLKVLDWNNTVIKAELQIRGGIEDKSKIVFLISQ